MRAQSVTDTSCSCFLRYSEHDLNYGDCPAPSRGLLKHTTDSLLRPICNAQLDTGGNACHAALAIGKPLPLPRTISTIINPDSSR